MPPGRLISWNLTGTGTMALEWSDVAFDPSTKGACMETDELLRKAGRIALTCILSGALVGPMATPALADDVDERIESLRQEEQDARNAAAAAEEEAQAARNAQAALEQEVAAAQEQLMVLGQEAEAAEYDYITITNQLEETKARIVELDGQIEQTRAELAVSKEELATIVSDTYKNGRPTLLSVALKATSFDDLLSRIQYANKVAAYETSVVEHVKDLEAQLEQERAEKEEQKALQEQQQIEQQERLEAAEAAIAQVEAYQAQLSVEIQQKIAEADAAMRQAAEEQARADAAEAQRLAEEEAKRKAEEEARRRAEEEARRQAEEEARRQAEAEAAAQASQSSSSTSSGGSSISIGGGASYTAPGSVSSFVARAYSIIGSGYSWSGYSWSGSPYSSVFTCSGVVDFALGLPPRSNSPETYYAKVGSRMKYDNSQLEYGDLVFYACMGRAPGHVGIYVGNGQVLDSIPNGGVAIRAVDYMPTMGGGSIF